MIVDVEIYSNGLVHCSVCAPADHSKEQVESVVNDINSTGIHSKWTVSDEPFSNGDPNGRVCDQDPDRRHWLMVC